jgi:uncharacterized protein (DUF302 family)
MRDAQRAIASRYGLEETVAELKAGIADADLWLIHEIDPQALVRKAGYEIRGARQLLFFHPRYMMRLLAANEAAIVGVPLKLVVMEAADGRVIVRIPDPAQALSCYPGVEELGAELARVVAEITRRVDA